MPESTDSMQKRVLFLHPNFPAQFKHLAYAASLNGHDARFLCHTHYGRSIPGVKRLTLKGSNSHKYLNSKGGDQIQRSNLLAKQYRNGLVKLKESGWQPDVVISHSGWGCGLHLKEVWPHCRHIAYLEWWFNPESDFFKYDANNEALKINSKKISGLWLRNQALALELVCADSIVAPTKWQSNQLPPLLQERCHIIHDGIDLNIFKPKPQLQQRDSPLITYGTRGMEPMRCFPQFIEGIVCVLLKNQDIQVEIAGEDTINYGGRSPSNHSTWKQWAKHLLNEAGLGARVKWLGRLNTKDYVSWLQGSNCHVHLSHPFVASWSLLEALACHSPLIVSDVQPIRELCEGTGAEVSYVDHRAPSALPRAIEQALQKVADSSCKPNPSRLGSYSLESSLRQWGSVSGLQLTTKH